MTEPKKTVVVICRGNIARSPFAAAVIEQELARRGLGRKFRVLSRGKQGTPVDPEPVKHPNITFYGQLYTDSKPTLVKFGVDLSRHVSQPITKDVADTADILLAVDTQVETALQTLFPAAASKICLLSELAGPRRDISDPEKATGAKAQQQIFTTLHDTIINGFDNLLAKS